MDEQKKEYLTKEKLEELERELDFLRRVRRREVAENLEYAKSLGDLSENAEYHEARDLQVNLEDRIAKLETLLKSAVVVSRHHTGAVEVGSTIVLHRDGGGEPQTFTIVSSEEANVAAGRISSHSPIGEALMGKHKGDTVDVTTPKGSVRYKVISIK